MTPTVRDFEDRTPVEWLSVMHQALERGGVEELQHVIAGIPTAVDIDAALDALTPEAWSQLAQRQTRRKSRLAVRLDSRLTPLILLAGVLGACVLGQLALWGYCLTNANDCHQRAVGTYTPTPVPSPTATPTASPVPTATATPLPEATPTALPSSRFSVDTLSLYPLAPLGGDGYWVINEMDAVAEPAFDNPEAWRAVQPEPGAADRDSYQVSIAGNVRVTWGLDVGLPAGLYEIYVLDTAAESQGELTFTIALDGEPVLPLRGTPHLILDGVNAAPEWLSLGFYDVAAGRQLSVQLALGPLSPETPMAVDRVLVVRVGATQRALVEALPLGRPLSSLLDDRRATVYALSEGEATRLRDESQGQAVELSTAWNGAFRTLAEDAIWPVAGNRLQVDWAPLGRLPAGTYALYVRVPDQLATVDADYQLLADGQPVPRDNPASLAQAHFAGTWASVGQWRLDREAAVGVRMIVSIEKPGDIGLDAVALCWVGE